MLSMTALLVGLFAVGTAQAESKVTLTKMHLCCGKCYKAVEKAVASVDGAAVAFDKKAKTATVSGKDDALLQSAINAIAKAGFHGKSDNAKVAMKSDAGVKGKVKRIELIGVHNCCGGCNKAIVKAIGSVDGVAGNNAKPNSSTVVVEGDFDAVALISSLFDAGFHVSVKK
jgi:copper chaperone CopZ